MPADSARLEALAQNRTLRQQKDAARKEAARRAWEGGEATLEEIAALVRADRKTVKRWAREGGWRYRLCGE